MSSGDQISDKRYTVSSPYGPSLAGEYFRKHWNGSDFVEGEESNEHAYTCNIVSSFNATCQMQDPWEPSVWNNGTMFIFGSPPYIVDAPWDNNDELKLINKLGKKIRGSDFNAGNLLGESHQTISLISTTATRIAKMLHYIRDGNMYKAAQEVSANIKLSRGHVLSKKNRKPLKAADVSNMVLELQYGWRPLLSDVHDAAHTLAKRLETPFHTTYRAMREKKFDEQVAPGGHRWLRQGRHAEYLKVKLKTKPTMSSILHLNDPMSVAWEVLGWSFVADWFLPIGDYLSAVDMYRSFEYQEILRTVVTEHKITHTGENGNSALRNIGGTSFSRDFSLSRGLSSNFGTFPPPPVFKNMKQALQPEHLLNAFALLTSTTDGFRKQLKF